MKEKLIELMKQSITHCECTNCTECKYYESNWCVEELHADNLIANGVTVREKGVWKSGMVMYHCDQCDKWLDVPQGTADMNFCPNCGADMRGDT